MVDGPEVRPDGLERVISYAEDLSLAVNELRVTEVDPLVIARLRVVAEGIHVIDRSLLRSCDAAEKDIAARNGLLRFENLPGDSFAERLAGPQWRPIVVPVDPYNLAHISVADDFTLEGGGIRRTFTSGERPLIDIFNVLAALQHSDVTLKQLRSRAPFWGDAAIKPEQTTRFCASLAFTLENMCSRPVVASPRIGREIRYRLDPNVVIKDTRTVPAE